jgi:hypothetical protein
LNKAIENSWPILLPKVKAAQELGYSLEDLKVIVEKGGNFRSLTRRSTEKAKSVPGERDSIPEFSLSTFHQFLLSFIVADDQVSGAYFRIFLILFFA